MVKLVRQGRARESMYMHKILKNTCETQQSAPRVSKAPTDLSNSSQKSLPIPPNTSQCKNTYNTKKYTRNPAKSTKSAHSAPRLLKSLPIPPKPLPNPSQTPPKSLPKPSPNPLKIPILSKKSILPFWDAFWTAKCSPKPP